MGLGEKVVERPSGLEEGRKLEDNELGGVEDDIAVERDAGVVLLEDTGELGELLEGGGDITDADALALEELDDLEDDAVGLKDE